MSSSRRKSLVDESKLDLTSMTDCIFLLLIFFILTTVFDQTTGLDVDVPPPQENQQQKKRQTKKDLNIVIDANGNIEVSGKKTTLDNLFSKIKAEYNKPKCSKNVIIQADDNTAHEMVVDVLDVVKKLKPLGIIFAREEEES